MLVKGTPERPPHLLFTRPALDWTYYGMVLSSVRQQSTQNLKNAFQDHFIFQHSVDWVISADTPTLLKTSIVAH